MSIGHPRTTGATKLLKATPLKMLKRTINDLGIDMLELMAQTTPDAILLELDPHSTYLIYKYMD